MTIRTAQRSGLWALGLLVTSCMGPLPEGTQVVRGPIGARAMHPLLLTQLALPPRRAATQPEGSWGASAGLAYMSIFERRNAFGERVRFDGEQGRGRLLVRRGVGPNSDLEFEFAGGFATSGFLDDFVDGFHDAFLLPDGGRSRAENDQFEMRIRKNGVLAFQVEEDQLAWADLPLIWNQRVREEDQDGGAVTLRAGLELPLGSESRGFGNGGLDWGLGLLFERSYTRWSLFAGLNWIAPHAQDSLLAADVQLKDRVELQFGSELRWTANTSLLFQANWIGPMTDSIDLEEINREIFDVGVGMAQDVGRARWTFSFHEDAVAATGADFGVRLALDWGF